MCLDIGGILAIAAALMNGGILFCTAFLGRLWRGICGEVIISNCCQACNGNIIADDLTIAIKSAWNG